MTNRATVQDLRSILSDGRFGTITFQKVDGSIRRLNGRIGVNKGVNGNGTSVPGVVKVYDVQRDAEGKIKGWRTVKPEKVMQIVANKMIYDFVKRDIDPEPFINDAYVIKGKLHVRMNKYNVYAYLQVPYNLIMAFLMSDSKGTFFNQNIKRNYSYEKIS